MWLMADKEEYKGNVYKFVIILRYYYGYVGL